MTLPCADVTVSLGAYLLGALDPPERAEVEAHLAQCPACRGEIARLAPLPGLLSRLSLEEVVSGPPPVDDAMLDRLLAACAHDRRTASRRRWLAVAAAVVILAGGTTAGVAGWSAAHSPRWQQTAQAASGGVHVSVQLADQAGGTKVHMSLDGVRSAERCSLVAVSRSGRTEVAGWWEASYSGTAHMDGTTSIARGDLAQLKVVTDAGRTLVVVPVHA